MAHTFEKVHSNAPAHVHVLFFSIVQAARHECRKAAACQQFSCREGIGLVCSLSLPLISLFLQKH